MSGSRLATGSRMAIIGGGIAGAGLAASLLFNGRARGISLDVRVYSQGDPDSVPPPVVLTPECRSRLAAAMTSGSNSSRAPAMPAFD